MDIKKKGKKKIMYGTLRILDFGKNCKSITRAVEKNEENQVMDSISCFKAVLLTRNSK